MKQQPEKSVSTEAIKTSRESISKLVLIMNGKCWFGENTSRGPGFWSDSAEGRSSIAILWLVCLLFWQTFLLQRSVSLAFSISDPFSVSIDPPLLCIHEIINVHGYSGWRFITKEILHHQWLLPTRFFPWNTERLPGNKKLYNEYAYNLILTQVAIKTEFNG